MSDEIARALEKFLLKLRQAYRRFIGLVDARQFRYHEERRRHD